jgi:hypothetical protein
VPIYCKGERKKERKKERKSKSGERTVVSIVFCFLVVLNYICYSGSICYD